MTFSIATLKQHLTDYANRVTAEEHAIVARFAEFVEGREAEADAVALLQSKGYSVTPPPAQG